MDPLSGAQTFTASGDAYDLFMGRYSRPLAARFAEFAGARRGIRALDVGCGPGALTAELVERLGAEAVAACDPSPSFVAACAERNPGVEVVRGPAEALPFREDEFDLAAASLVLHFVSDAWAAGAEMARVTRPGGTVAASVWAVGGQQMLGVFWEAAASLDPDCPSDTLLFGEEGELAAWLTSAGLAEVTETAVTVASRYAGFDELWSGYLAGVGPAGSYLASLPEERRTTLRAALFDHMGRPEGAITLEATARVGRGTRR